MNNNFLDLKPIQKFTGSLGNRIKNYFGKDAGCIIGLGDDGVFYAIGIYEWLKNKNVKIDITFMDDNGLGIEEEKVIGKKVLIVDNDIITGKSYKRVMESMRLKKEKLNIKDIKFAVLCDRTGLADFAVEGYLAFAPWSLKKIDGIDSKIINILSDDGRASFVDIAKKIGLSSAGVKKRVERLENENVLKIKGFLNIEEFYSVSATIEIETDSKTISQLIELFEKSPLVYHLIKTSGRYNLMVSIVAPNLDNIENFISQNIRSNPKIKNIEVTIGEIPIIPKVWNPPIS